VKSNYIFVGGLIVVLTFSAFFYFLLNSRKSSLEKIVTFPKAQVFNKNDFDQLNYKQKQEVAAEAYSSTILTRGQVVSYNPSSRLASIITHITPENHTEELQEIDLTDINQVLCWPEKVGSNQIKVKNSYIPIQPDLNLYLAEQTTSNLNQQENQLVGSFIFVHLRSPKTSNGVFTAKEVAMIGCK
jgi:hypothetical protein